MRRRSTFSIKIAGRDVRLGTRTIVMGVVNVTPDSFSDGGRYLDPESAIRHGVALARQGADWIDVGGESTRPGSQPVDAEEELRRVLPVIRGLVRRLPAVPISIDTTKSGVAEAACDAGARIINDVSGLRFDPRLAEVAARYRTPLVLMHMRGRPATMQQGPFARSIWRSVEGGLERSIRTAVAGGVRRSQLILDPGLGFGKTRRQNYQLLAGLERLKRFGLPILAGTSRKSFVQALAAGEGLDPLGRPERRAKDYWALTSGLNAGRRVALQAGKQDSKLRLLIGDAAAVVAAILAGAHIVRVHDAEAAMPALRIADAILAVRR